MPHRQGMGTLHVLDELKVMVIIQMADMKASETEAVWKTLVKERVFLSEILMLGTVLMA